MKPKFTFGGHDGRINSVAYSPTGHLLGAASDDRTVSFWAMVVASTSRSTRPLIPKARIFGVNSGAAFPTTSIDFSGDGRQVVLGHHADNGSILNATTLQPVGNLIGHRGFIPVAVFSPNSRRIITGSLDRTARIWDARTLESSVVLKGHTQETSDGLPAGVWSVAFAPNGREVATAGSDGTVRIWNAVSGSERRILRGHRGVVFSVAYSPKGDQLATSGADGTVRLWDLPSAAPGAVLTGHGGWVACVKFSPDGGSVASASWDKTVRVWNLRADTAPTSLPHPDKCHFVAWDPVRPFLATACEDGAARVWEFAKT